MKWAAVNRSISLPIETEKKLMLSPPHVVFLRIALWLRLAEHIRKGCSLLIFTEILQPAACKRRYITERSSITFRREAGRSEKERSFCYERLPESRSERHCKMRLCGNRG